MGNDLLQKALDAVAALSPEQQREMWEAQRQSWARGEADLDLVEQVEALIRQNTRLHHGKPTDQVAAEIIELVCVSSCNTNPVVSQETPSVEDKTAPAGNEVTIPRNPTDEMMNAGLYHCSHDMEWSGLYTAWQAMFDAVTLDGGITEQAKASAAPAATDTGLETVGEVDKYPHGTYFPQDIPEGAALCLRSQAEELLAAERAEKERLSDDYQAIREQLLRGWRECKDLKADNAAKDARIKELDTERDEALDDAKFAERIATKREIDANASVEALEAQLASAEKALETCDRKAEAGLCYFTLSSARIFLEEIRQVVNAALGGKPS